MLKKLLFLLAVPALFFACENKKTDNAEGDEAEVAVVEIANFDNVAPDMVDQQIEVSGLVDHICKKNGKKMHLVTGDGEKASVHIMSDEAFPEDLEGQYVNVIGKVVEEKITLETIAQWEEEDAKMKAEEEAKATEEIEGEATEGETEAVAEETTEINDETVVEENNEECEDGDKEDSDCKGDEEEGECEEGEEDHHPKDGEGRYAKIKEKIAESADGIYRVYHIEYISHEVVENK